MYSSIHFDKEAILQVSCISHQILGSKGGDFPHHGRVLNVLFKSVAVFHHGFSYVHVPRKHQHPNLHVKSAVHRRAENLADCYFPTPRWLLTLF